MLSPDDRDVVLEQVLEHLSQHLGLC